MQILDYGAEDALARFQTLVRELTLIASYKPLGPLPLAFSSHQLNPHPSKIGLIYIERKKEKKERTKEISYKESNQKRIGSTMGISTLYRGVGV